MCFKTERCGFTARSRTFGRRHRLSSLASRQRRFGDRCLTFASITSAHTAMPDGTSPTLASAMIPRTRSAALLAAKQRRTANRIHWKGGLVFTKPSNASTKTSDACLKRFGTAVPPTKKPPSALASPSELSSAECSEHARAFVIRGQMNSPRLRDDSASGVWAMNDSLQFSERVEELLVDTGKSSGSKPARSRRSKQSARNPPS